MSQPKPNTLEQSPLRLVLILACSIFAVEFGLMIFFSALPPLKPWIEAAVDATLLVTVLLPIVLFFVYRPLTRRIQEREQAEAALSAAHDQLELRVQQRTADLELRNREIRLLADMSNFLQACATADEAYGVITHTAQQLFLESTGALFVFSASRNDLEAMATWGELAISPNERVFSPEECCALRRGRAHIVEDPRSALSCRHMAAHPAGRYLCVPMMAQGEALGVLHLRHNPPGAESAQGILTRKAWLAVPLAEHVALALANLKLRETLRNQSIRDPLTGLFNRRYMEETLEREIRRSERSHRPLGAVMIDIDHFKHFNDTFGHEAGDLLLREVGALLATQIRDGDIACRHGGEEFALILPESPLEAVRQRAEELRLGVRQMSVQYRGQSLGAVTVSAGVAVFPEHGGVAEALLRATDRALYRAKGAGRDRVVLAEPCDQ
ncbi:MAG: diguanylate cyclase [Acidobacteria bacterium]|nr:diguanylate cyclase [Acidobacteriota bacterium]MBI3656160.1 diguanylate cyclase [Acidobacteriota bacterium]